MYIAKDSAGIKDDTVGLFTCRPVRQKIHSWDTEEFYYVDTSKNDDNGAYGLRIKNTFKLKVGEIRKVRLILDK